MLLEGVQEITKDFFFTLLSSSHIRVVLGIVVGYNKEGINYEYKLK